VNLALPSALCQAMQERRTEQLERADRHPDEIENERATRDDVNRAPVQITRAPKSAEPTVLIPTEQQIRQRAYELLRAARKDRRSRFGRLASSRA